MTEFDPEKFDEKYVYYFEELEEAYSKAYQQLHGRVDSDVLRTIDRQVLDESEPVYEGDGSFRVAIPDGAVADARAMFDDPETFDAVLADFTDGIEAELSRTFEFDT